MQYKKSRDLLGQQVRGFLVLNPGDGICSQLTTLVESLHCEVLKGNAMRLIIKGTRGNLQSIKNLWLANDQENSLSQELNECVQKMIISGRA